ncbi:MAG: hypothetical protein A2W91_08770 [Bacteroidetes bacterium GWF2_38_335]|nr:MAG: hypothetical protein A2W91_08770 [Bacteroidetes bacterium GWF2_38_335]OFY80467.1 MAG: hypothetical protein A2281_08495 [Bacteroidetes bacterium RIFOXYA12_FULL_38_20]HBS85927.1 hypothetical protein [Bacteroidales bacterium]
MKVFVLLILVIYSSVLFSQDTINKSFYHTNLFTEDKSFSPVVRAITGLKDGGFAYLVTFFYCAIDSSFNIFDFSKKVDDLCCIERSDYSKLGYPYSPGRSLLFKVNSSNQIEWVKSVFNKNFEYSASTNPNQGVIKQTCDNGLICTIHGRVTKLDINGNLQWEIYFDRDTIPGIKKSEFLKKATPSDIYECKDGSFILLLNASFSLLKISADGKPLWLKSTVFDTFDPQVEIMRPPQTDTSFGDSIEVNSSNWFSGGGQNIRTSNVFETDDGGYMMIGNNCFRCKCALYELSKEQLSKKYIYTIGGSYNNYYQVPIHPEKLYLYGYRPAGGACLGEYKPVVVKTDDQGNVKWTKTFGECMSDYPSNLIKLANNKWLVRIRDCDRSGAFPVFYTIDDDGKIIDKKEFNVFKCDPWDMTLAKDSGYYLFEQFSVTKTDKNLKFLWQQGGFYPSDKSIFSATEDSGILFSDRQTIYKYNKYGDALPEKDPIIDSIITDNNSAHFFFTFSTNRFNDRKATLVVKKKGSNGIKRIYERKYLIEHDQEYMSDLFDKECIYYIHTNPGEKIKYLKRGKFLGKEKEYEKWIFNISNPLHVNALIIDARDITSPYANESNAKKLKFDSPANELEIRSIFGYSQVYIDGLEKGEYKYILKYPNGDKITSGYFEIK